MAGCIIGPKGYKGKLVVDRRRKLNSYWAILVVLAFILSSSMGACAKPAVFEVMSLDVTPRDVLAGETVTITAEVRNIGGSAGGYNLSLTIDGVVTETRVITLAPETAEKVVFSLTKDKAGIYQISVGKLSSSLKIKEPTLEQLKVDYPELYQELIKLPELKEIDEKDKEAIEDIAYLALQPKYKTAFESMLNEGIKDKRKYCTPIQALLWISYDRELDKDNLISNGSLTIWISNAWMDTTTSKYFSSEAWKNFGEVTDRLNSPKLIEIYMQRNYTYSYTKGELEGFKSAEDIFRAKKGACYDHAVFAGYCLKKNGYDTAKGLALRFDRQVQDYFIGHVVCVYQDTMDSLYYTIDNVGGSRVNGPFQSIVDAAKDACYRGSLGKVNLLDFSLHDIELETGKYKTIWMWR